MARNRLSDRLRQYVSDITGDGDQLEAPSSQPQDAARERQQVERDPGDRPDQLEARRERVEQMAETEAEREARQEFLEEIQEQRREEIREQRLEELRRENQSTTERVRERVAGIQERAQQLGGSGGGRRRQGSRGASRGRQADPIDFSGDLGTDEDILTPFGGEDAEAGEISFLDSDESESDDEITFL